MNGASSHNNGGGPQDSSDGAAQSNITTSTTSPRKEARTTGIRRGFLNNTVARRTLGGGTQQSGATSIQPLVGATPVTRSSTQAAADESSSASVNDSTQSAAARPTRAAASSPLAAAARSMWGGGGTRQSASASPAAAIASTTSPSITAASVAAQQQQGPQQQQQGRQQNGGQQQGDNDEDFQASWGQNARATLLPHDEETRLAMSRGTPVSAYHYSLPFAAPDGRQTLIIMPGDFTPERRPDMPHSPFYFPAGGGNSNVIPLLYDDVSSTGWHLINISRGGDGPMPPLPGGAFDGRNPRRPHFFAGPPMPARVSLPAGMPNLRQYEQAATSAVGATIGSLWGGNATQRSTSPRQTAASASQASVPTPSAARASATSSDAAQRTPPAPPAAARSTSGGSGAGSTAPSHPGASSPPSTTTAPARPPTPPGYARWNQTAARSMWGSGATSQAWSDWRAPAQAALRASREVTPTSSRPAVATSSSHPKDSDEDNGDPFASMRKGFDKIRPRPKAATREAFFTDLAARRARNSSGRSPSPPPQSHHPREERQTRAQLLPADHTTYLELMTGIRVPTAHFSLPFTAADGRQTLVAMPGDVVALKVPGSVDFGLNLWDFWGLEAPEDPQERLPYMPYQPMFTPASSGQPAMFFDERSGFFWPLLPASDASVPYWMNIRDAHYVVAAPPFSVAWLNRDDVVEAFPGFSLDQGSAQRGREAEEYTARIKRFLDGLETADVELRARMARLGIGEIGDSDGSEEDARGPGCAICLEVFGKESDRPEWMGGAEVHERRVIVSTCAGFHLYHRGCLRQALAAVMTWRKWSCPLCRAPLRDEAAKRAEAAERGASASSPSTSAKGKAKAKAGTSATTSLREEVHRREKEKGYVCDDPACYSGGSGSGSTTSSSNNNNEGVVVDKGQTKPDAQAKTKGKAKAKS